MFDSIILAQCVVFHVITFSTFMCVCVFSGTLDSILVSDVCFLFAYAISIF